MNNCEEAAYAIAEADPPMAFGGSRSKGKGGKILEKNVCRSIRASRGGSGYLNGVGRPKRRFPTVGCEFRMVWGKEVRGISLEQSPLTEVGLTTER